MSSRLDQEREGVRGSDFNRHLLEGQTKPKCAFSTAGDFTTPGVRVRGQIAFH
jgi:hypothetical protein